VSPYSKEVAMYLKPMLDKAGIKVVSSAEYPPDIKDMTVQLLQVKNAKPDAVLSLSYPSDSVIYVRQAAETGVNAPFQFVMLGPSASFFPKLLGATADGVLAMGDWAPTLNAKSHEFDDAYRAKYHEAPDYLDSAESYAACQVLEEAVAKVGLDHKALTDEIAGGQFDTIFGPIKFNGIERQGAKMVVLQMQQGAPQAVWPPAIAKVNYVPKTATK
jgi:branched-chain amino acid transport system substrate-binding protein